MSASGAEWSPAVDINYGYTGFYSTPDKQLPEEGIIATGIPQAEEWQIVELDLELTIDGLQLLVHRLRLLFGCRQLFVRQLELFVGYF